MPDYHLIVTHEWGDYARGDRITDAAKIEEILNSEHQRRVVRVAATSQEG